MMSKLEKTECAGCDYQITIIPAFEGLYCNKYCCACCPDAKVSPCQKEKKFGDVVENLAKAREKLNG